MAIPARSVIVPGMIRQRPPTTARILWMGFILVTIYPSRPPATPVRPTREVTMMITTWTTSASMNSIAGLKAKIYGTMKAAIARREAFKAVFMGLDLAMAEPA